MNGSALRQLLFMAWEQTGHVTAAQIRSLLAWEGTPADVRERLRKRLSELGDASAFEGPPEPLTAAQENYLRGQGVLDALDHP